DWPNNLNWIFFRNHDYSTKVPSITVDGTNNQIYSILGKAGIGSFDTITETCTPFSLINTLFSGGSIADDHKSGNVVFCDDFGDQLEKQITNSVLEDIVFSGNSMYLSDSGSHKIYQINMTSGLNNPDSYFWIGKCSDGPQCDKNDNQTRGFSCGMFFDGNQVMSSEVQCSGSGLGTQTGQFSNPTHLTIDSITGEFFTVDFPINEKTGSTEPRVQKFSEQVYFVEDFISTLSRPEFTNDPELLTVQSAGFFDAGEVKGIAKASNFFYAADEKKLHFFDTNPFEPALWGELTPEPGFAFSNVTYQYFIQNGSDSFKFRVTDGFDDSNIGTVELIIDNIDCDDDGVVNRIDKLENGTETHGCTSNATNPAPVDWIRFSDDTTYGLINATENAENLFPIRVVDMPSPDGVFLESDVDNLTTVSVVMCGEYKISMESGDRIIAKCASIFSPSEVQIVRGKNIPVSVFKDDAFGKRESGISLSYPDRISFVVDEFFFESLASSGQAKPMVIKYNDETYTYQNSLGPESQLQVDTLQPILNCPDDITIQADLGGPPNQINLINSSSTTLTQIHEFWQYVTDNSVDEDNSSPD
ncbi:MAG: hypothetical protein ACE5RG_08885, partial [Candidatus Nitrosomaritimum yanchengensis]